jgi:transcriptional regulator with XRE-family HTH domain
MNRKIGELTKKFGLKIRFERIKKNLSLEKLAELAHLNRNSVYAIEKGKSTPTLETMNLLAQALDIKLTELIDVEKFEL